MQDSFQSHEAILLHLVSVSQLVIQSLDHVLSTLITALLSSSLPIVPTPLMSSRSAPPLLSSVVATYETGVTVHPRCLLEFRFPVSFAWQGLDLSLESESVALNYSFRGHRMEENCHPLFSSSLSVFFYPLMLS